MNYRWLSSGPSNRWKENEALLVEIMDIFEESKDSYYSKRITRELIFHSDRGIQYACNDFSKILKTNKLISQSMSRKGNCWDNAVAESFFKTIKVEWIYNQNFINQEQAQLSIFEWIESWYNRRRRHSALGYQTIEELEKNNYIFINAA